MPKCDLYSSVEELEALRRENAALHEQAEFDRSQIAQLIEQLARLNERVAELLALAQRKQRKARAVPPAPPAPPPVVEGDERRAFEERPKAPAKAADEPAKKKKTKPTGRKRWAHQTLTRRSRAHGACCKDAKVLDFSRFLEALDAPPLRCGQWER